MTNFLYSFISIVICSIFSFILNKIYNLKSERKFYTLINQIKSNCEFIIKELQNYEKKIENYEKEYEMKATNLIKNLYY